MYKGVLLDADTLGMADIDLGAIHQLPIEWAIYKNSRPDQVAERIADADIVITNKAPVMAADMASSLQLKLIAVAATGVNVIDVPAATAGNITVCNCAGYGTESVVQHTFALLLALCTRLADYHQDCITGRWQQSPMFCRLDYPVQQLSGKTLGIVGYGELGRGVARIARCFGMTVKIACLPGRSSEGRVPLSELLPQIDVLTLHCPLTEQTHNLIGDTELALMKSDALLLNVARGGIVNEQALARALRNGVIAGAGVDVLSSEPPRKDNPLLLGDIPNLLITPHTAWSSQPARQALVNQVAENIRAFLDGAPIRRIQ